MGPGARECADSLGFLRSGIMSRDIPYGLTFIWLVICFKAPLRTVLKIHLLMPKVAHYLGSRKDRPIRQQAPNSEAMAVASGRHPPLGVDHHKDSTSRYSFRNNGT